MNAEGLEARVRSLDDRLRTIEDVQEIECLQIMYGYYLEDGMWDAVVDLFSDNTESIELGDRGIFLGKTGVESVCKLMKEGRVPKETGPQGNLHGMVVPRIMFHTIMIGQPVIDLDPGSKAAYGRWGAMECAVRPVKGTWLQYWGRGLYENEYVKEDGRWRFNKLHWYLTLLPLYENGWLKTPTKIYTGAHPTIKPDRPGTFDHRYPDPGWCTVPFHYKHPITGK